MSLMNGFKYMLAVSVLFLLGCDKVMTQLSTRVTSPWGDPVVMWVKVGDYQLTENRPAGRDVGGPLDLGPDGLLHYDAAWLSFDGVAWTAQFSIDPTRLTTHEGAGVHGSIKITFGPGADVTVTTPHPEFLKKRGVPPPSGDYADLIPVGLLETCGTPLPADDPRLPLLRSGLDLEYAMGPARARRDRFLADNPPPQSRCKG